MPKGYFSYVRVSTVKQGQTGTSLAEQREAIKRYAQRSGLSIVREFEEQETAAKSGRPLFLQMLDALKQQKAIGVIIHKIDRSARNLHDWAALGEMIDSGIEVHFANENVNLESRGGRLSADIQAVVAADYIRNLREEVKKGFYGRLKQGFYPMPAPAGYLDNGPGQEKKIDPVQGPLIKRAFEMYASGRWGLNALVVKMFSEGLRNRNGGRITRNGMSHLLHNWFYVGLIKIRRCDEFFVGRHRAIVSRELFDKVQRVIVGKNVKGVRRHDFMFKRLLSCGPCGGKLIGETKKGYVYYRCHKTNCGQKSVREELVESELKRLFDSLRFSKAELDYLKQEIAKQYLNHNKDREELLKGLSLQQDLLKTRESKLTDAYLDAVIDKSGFTEKKNSLLLQQQKIAERRSRIERGYEDTLRILEEILGQANNAYLSFKMANLAEKRELVKTVTSDIFVDGKKVIGKLKTPFKHIAERQTIPNGRPFRDTTRTLSALLSQLIEYFISRKDKDEEEAISKPVAITPHRLRLAFRRASSETTHELAA